MDFKDKEKNKWIDDAYLVIAKSQFYKRSYFDAQRTSDYIGRHFKGQDQQLRRQALAGAHAHPAGAVCQGTDRRWMRCSNEKELPKGFPHDELSAVQADLDVKRGKVDDAIINLERAVEIAEKQEATGCGGPSFSRSCTRPRAMKRRPSRSTPRVTRMNPPYELGFHAQIFQALAFDAGSSKALRQKLNRMLQGRQARGPLRHDPLRAGGPRPEGRAGQQRHRAPEDQRAREHHGHQAEGQELPETGRSLFRRRANTRTRSSITTAPRRCLTETHVRYEEVKTRAEVLGELVEQLDIIAREDSLQALAGLDEKDLEKLVRGHDPRSGARGGGKGPAPRRRPARPAARPSRRTNRPARAGRQGQLVLLQSHRSSAAACAEFRKKWGNRHWRTTGGARTRAVAPLVELAEEEGDGDEEKAERRARKENPNGRTPKYYTKDIPADAAALDASNERICEALYKSGHDLQGEADGRGQRHRELRGSSTAASRNAATPPRATTSSTASTWRRNTRRTTSTSAGMGSQTYANIILERWPDSEFARLVRDPNALQADEARKTVEEAEYEQVYRRIPPGQLSVGDRHLQHGDHQRAAEPPPAEVPPAEGHGRRRHAKKRPPSATRSTEVKTKFPGTDEAKAAE